MKKICLWLLLAMLTGCDSSDDSKLIGYFNTIKLLKAEPISTISLTPVLATFSYPESTRGRNPFKALSQNFASEKLTADSLIFVGTWKSADTIWGLVKQPDGEVIRVKAGDLLPLFDAKVMHVGQYTMQIEQILPQSQQRKIIQFNLSAVD